MRNALLSNFHLQLEPEAPVEEIIKLLNVIAQDLKDQQVAAGHTHNSQT